MRTASLKRMMGLWVTSATVVLAVLGGCRMVGPGATFKINQLEALVSATPQRVSEATKAAMEELHLVLISAESTGLDARVVARTARKKNVIVTITRSANNISQVNIQVGSWGDEDISMLILEKIKAKL